MRHLAAMLLGPVLAAAEPLTAASAIARALDRNEAPAIALARIAQARAMVDAAEAARRPLALLDGRMAVSQASPDAPGGRSLVLQAAWRPFNPGALSAVRAAEHAAWAANQDAAGGRRALAFAVVDALIDARMADALIAARRSGVDTAGLEVAQAQALLDAGMTTAIGPARAQLDLARARLALEQTASAAAEARLALGELLAGEPPPAIADLPEPATPAGTPAMLVPQAVQLREDLQSLDLRAAAAAHRIAQADAAWLPWAEVRAAVGRAAGDGAGEDPRWALTLHAQWSVFDGGNLAAAGDLARADALRADRAWSAAGRGVARELGSAAAACASTQAALRVAGSAAILARQHHADVAARRRNGLATALEAADARSALAEAEALVIAAVHEHRRAGYRLRRAAGLWPLTTVEP